MAISVLLGASLSKRRLWSCRSLMYYRATTICWSWSWIFEGIIATHFHLSTIWFNNKFKFNIRSATLNISVQELRFTMHRGIFQVHYWIGKNDTIWNIRYIVNYINKHWYSEWVYERMNNNKAYWLVINWCSLCMPSYCLPSLLLL